MTTPNKKTRFVQGAALMREDIVTPMHHHDEAQDALLVEVDGITHHMTGCQADGYVTEKYDLPELTDVDHVEGGPRGVKRRHILAGAAAGFGALLTTTTMPRYSFAQAAESTGPQELLVCVFMRGGFDGLSAVVPLNDGAYYAARPTIAVKAEQTLPLDGTWGLSTHMKAIKPIWDAGQLAIIQGSGSPDVSRSHFVDQVTVERAAPASVRSGWLGRHLQTLSADTGTFRGITVGSSAVFSLATNNLETLAVSSIDSFDLSVWTGKAKPRIQTALDEMYAGAGGQVQETAAATLDAAGTLAQLRTDDSSLPQGYPDSTWGRGLSEIARMAKAGVGVEVACIDIGDWDMHSGLGSAADEQAWFSRRARDFAEGLAAFRNDLGDKWATTTVVTMSEFGRRVAENGSAGTDHGQGNTMFVMGGGVKGGRVLGTVPALDAANLSLGDVPITLDYRQALSEIVQVKLGNTNIPDVFPGFTPGAPLGIV